MDPRRPLESKEAAISPMAIGLPVMSKNGYQNVAPIMPASAFRNTADLPSRTNNRSPGVEVLSSRDANVAKVESQLLSAIEAIPCPQQQDHTTSKSAPRQTGFTFAKSLQLIRSLKDCGRTYASINCNALEKLFNYIGILQKQNKFLNFKPPTGRTKHQSIVTLPPTPPSVPATSFILFPKLPLEIRLIIWKIVLCTPRTISVDIIIPRPVFKPTFTRPLTNIGAVSRESRGEAVKTQRQLNKVQIGETTVYINPSVDIVWISGWGIGDNEWLSVLNQLPKTLVQAGILKFAVGLELWDRLMCEEVIRSKFLDAVSTFGTEELIIVVGSTAAFGSVNLLMIKPRGKPRHILHTNFTSRFRQLPADVPWDGLNEAMMLEISNQQVLRSNLRKRITDAGLNPDNFVYRGRFKDLSHLTFKRVRFMEATTYAAMKGE